MGWRGGCELWDSREPLRPLPISDLGMRCQMLDLNRIDEAIRSEGGISRRLLLAYGAALAGIPLLGLRAADQPKAAPRITSTPFTLGVASGEPYDTSVVIWTRLAPKPEQADGGI